MTDIKIENVCESPLIRSIQLTTKDARGETDLGQSIVGIDTSKFALKDHKHELTDVNGLDSALASKANNGHGHEISAITGLNDRLSKLSTNDHRHDVSTLDNLNQIKQIDSFNTFTQTISSNDKQNVYTFSVTPNTGNLLIMANGVSAAEYLKSTGSWNLKIYGSVTDTVLTNGLSEARAYSASLIDEKIADSYANMQSYVDSKDTILTNKFTSAINGLQTSMTSSMLNSVYPIGAIYSSTNDTNPSTLFGGVWESIEFGTNELIHSWKRSE